MGRPELGTKRTCVECHERFYDLNRSPPICPKCGAQQPAEKPRLSRPPRSPAIGTHRLGPPAAVSDDDAEAAGAPEVVEGDEGEDDVAELDVETDDDIEIDTDRPQTAD